MQTTSQLDALQFARTQYAKQFGGVFSNRCAQFLLDPLEAPPNCQLLDVATGPGTALFEALCKYNRLTAIYGVDVSATMLRSAQSIFNAIFANTAVQARFSIADAADLPFDENAFDCVVSNLGIHLFREKAKALQEMRRVLLPRGHLGLSIPFVIPASFMLISPIGHMRELLREWLEIFREYLSPEYTMVDELMMAIHNTGFRLGSVASTVIAYPCTGAQEAIQLIKTVLYFSSRLPSVQLADMFSKLDSWSRLHRVITDTDTYNVPLGVTRIWSTKCSQ